MKTRLIPVKPNFVAVIDEADYELVAAHKWRGREFGHTVYAYSSKGVLMHRLILGLKDGDGKARNGFKGIQKIGNGFAAYIGAKRVYLGFFPTAEAAARAYDAMAIKLYGQFARLNFPVSFFPNSSGITPLPDAQSSERRAA